MESIEASANLESEKIIQERKEKVLNLFKLKKSWIFYLLLILLVWLAIWLRTLNTDGLKDVTTNSWTLGPDLDPFLFLRWAKDIVATGSLNSIDSMRYVPLGFSTKQELVLLPYMIAWFHKIASSLGSVSVDHSAVLFPAYMFGLTVIAFFLLTRKIFIEKLGESRASTIALISSFLLTVIPSLLPRTIAGIPEKESVGFLFMFLAFYFFICSWKSNEKIKGYIYSCLSALSTSIMALVWGGFIYIYITIAVATGIAFILGNVKKENFIYYSIWLILSFLLISIFTDRYNLVNLLTSSTTGSATAIFLIMLLDKILNIPRIKKYSEIGFMAKIPPNIRPIIIIIAILVIFSLVQPKYIIQESGDILKNLVTPTTDRLGVTVAENRQPYFSEWSGSFGPVIRNIPLLFWLFFAGSIYLFYNIFTELARKEKIILTLSYAILLAGLIFSRYSPSHTLNGTNSISLFLYIIGFFIFSFFLGKKSQDNEEKKESNYNTYAIISLASLCLWILAFRDSTIFLIISILLSLPFFLSVLINVSKKDHLKNADEGILILFVLFFLSIVSARGAVRLIMVLVPPASIIVSYFVVMSISDSFKMKDESKKIFAFILAGLVFITFLFSSYNLLEVSKAQAASFVPNIYTQQWQYAMSWVRDNTQKDAVFGHWWDYGYWVQSIGERATVLDGGNAISFWNHMMGRYALTGNDSLKAAEFLFAHNTTHFLIDSSDIGKYAAFSSIGSDEKYDRSSWINSFVRNPQAIGETKNGTVYRYEGGTSLDEDISYVNNGSNIRLPGGKTGIGGILTEQSSEGKIISQPTGLFVYQNQLYTLPLRYSFSDNKLTDFGTGVEAGIFLMPKIDQKGQGVEVDKMGALLYLSKRTVKSQLARLYLYKDNDQYFKLVHSEDDIVVKQLKASDQNLSDIVFFGGVRGPIRIWEINYPKGMVLNNSYLSTEYPDSLKRS